MDTNKALRKRYEVNNSEYRAYFFQQYLKRNPLSDIKAHQDTVEEFGNNDVSADIVWKNKYKKPGEAFTHLVSSESNKDGVHNLIIVPRKIKKHSFLSSKIEDCQHSQWKQYGISNESYFLLESYISQENKKMAMELLVSVSSLGIMSSFSLLSEIVEQELFEAQQNTNMKEIIYGKDSNRIPSPQLVKKLSLL